MPNPVYMRYIHTTPRETRETNHIEIFLAFVFLLMMAALGDRLKHIINQRELRAHADGERQVPREVVRRALPQPAAAAEEERSIGLAFLKLEPQEPAAAVPEPIAAPPSPTGADWDMVTDDVSQT